MHSVSRNCLKVHAYFKISCKEMHLRWSLLLLVSSLTDKSKFACVFSTLPFAFFSFDTTCSRWRWYILCNLDRNSWCQVERAAATWPAARHHPGGWKSCTHIALTQKTAAFLHKEGICTRARPLSVSGVGCFFMSDVNLKGSWAVATIFWAILEICSCWKRLRLKHEWPAPHSSKYNASMFAKRLVWARLLVNSLNTSKSLIVAHRF